MLGIFFGDRAMLLKFNLKHFSVSVPGSKLTGGSQCLTNINWNSFRDFPVDFHWGNLSFIKEKKIQQNQGFVVLVSHETAV